MRRAATVLLMLTSCALTHAGSYEGQSLQVQVSPEKPFVTGQVTVSGGTGAFEENTTVTAIFSHPSGPRDTRTAQLDEDGLFEITFSPLDEVGDWTVEVSGPLSEVTDETASVTFTVIQPAAFAAVTVRTFTEATDAMDEFIDVTEEQLALYTQLPDKDEARQTIQQCQGHTAAIDQHMNQVADTLDEMGGLMGDLAAFPELHESMASLASQLQGPLADTQATMVELQYTHETANRAREWCRTWHAQKQGLHMLKKMVQFIYAGNFSIAGWVKGQFTGPMKKVQTKLEDKAVCQNTGMTEEQVTKARQAYADLQKAQSRLEQLMDIEGNALDIGKEGLDKGYDWLIDWISSKVAKNCGMYDADVTGLMYVEYYAKGVVYMVTKYRWEGRLELFFQKRQSDTDIVQLKGQLWGSFDWRIGKFFPERTAMDIPGVTGFGLCIPRPPYPDIRDFYLTLEGEGKPEGVELHVKACEYDRPELEYGFISVLWSPYQMVPAVDFPTCKVPGGEWFVTRCTGVSTPDVDSFYVPLEVDEDDVFFKHTIDRTMDYREEQQFRAFLKMEIDGKEDSI